MAFVANRPVETKRSTSAARSRRPVVRAFARLGLVARGVIYGVIGVLSLKLALGAGGRTESQTGALKTVAKQEFGLVLLIALAVGLLAYAIWRLFDGFTDSGPENTGLRRIAAIGAGLAYAALAFVAIEIIVGSGSSSSGSQSHATAGVLGWPAGPEIVFAAGLGMIGGAGYQVYKGFSRKFLRDSETERMHTTTRRVFTDLGIVGHVARGVTFGLIGYGLIKTAADYSAKSTIGLDGALAQLQHAAAGPFLLGAVALGFIAFGLYSIADSAWHRL